MNSFYSEEELIRIGFKSIGINVKISRNAQFYNVGEIEIGKNVRIDDFCVLSGRIKLGNFIHVSAFSGLFAGEAGIYVDDYCTISSRCMIYAISDDYSGNYMTNPTVPNEFRNVQVAPVKFSKHSILGTGCTVLPGVNVSEGVAVGAMSLVKKDLDSWCMYAGIPAKKINERKKGLIDMANILELGKK